MLTVEFWLSNVMVSWRPRWQQYTMSAQLATDTDVSMVPVAVVQPRSSVPSLLLHAFTTFI